MKSGSSSSLSTSITARSPNGLSNQTRTALADEGECVDLTFESGEVLIDLIH